MKAEMLLRRCFCCAITQLRARPPNSWGFYQTNNLTHTRQNSSKRVITWSQRSLPTQHRTNTRDAHPCPQRDSNPRSQQSINRKPSPQTSRPSVSARTNFPDAKTCYNSYHSLIPSLPCGSHIFQRYTTQDFSTEQNFGTKPIRCSNQPINQLHVN